MIYLDNAASTKIAPEVLDAMMPFLTEEYGNPGVYVHEPGRVAKWAIDRARLQVAEFMGASPDQIIFTSGGTEGNYMVLLGLVEHLREAGRTHVIVSNIEHDSVLRAAESLRKLGFHVSEAKADNTGVITAMQIREMITPQTGLVSVMSVNNEIGSVNPISQIAKTCHDNGVLFHSDCVQSAGTVPFSLGAFGCDFVTIASHKIHGPKGVGAVYAKDKSLLRPIIEGGISQEYGLRGGTQNVPAIVGFGEACAQCDPYTMLVLKDTIPKFKREFCDTLFAYTEKLSGRLGITVNGDNIANVSKVLSLCIDGINAETLLMALDMHGVYMSAGAACNGSEAKPSHVLLAIGLSPDEAMQTIRVSFSRFNKMEEVESAAIKTAECIAALRKNNMED